MFLLLEDLCQLEAFPPLPGSYYYKKNEKSAIVAACMSGCGPNEGKICVLINDKNQSILLQ